MELIGIENEGEFFPSGTLTDGLQDELREVNAAWTRDLGRNTPVDRLRRIATPHLDALRKLGSSEYRDSREELARRATSELVQALGYIWEPSARASSEDGIALIPLLSIATDPEGRDRLWILNAPLTDLADGALDPLGACFTEQQFDTADLDDAETERPIEELLGEIFSLKRGPRYVLVLTPEQIVLTERNRWPSRAVLRFDLNEIFSRKDDDTLITMACLLARESRAPQNGTPLAERLEEEAQRNANAVTASLKSTVRDAIEILGQEALTCLGPKAKNISGADLSREALRYMYRLLFLFYAEANPRLGILDLRDPLYATGYSVENLRELESRKLRTPQEREGTFLWETLQTTLGMLYSGEGAAMKLPAVKISLLDPDSTPILNSLKLRNAAIQQIIRMLSLKRTRSGTSRISYARLGIGQLGAVYETLISFTGVIAHEDLIELRPQTGRGTASDETEAEEEPDDLDDDEETTPTGQGAARDLLAPSYFVPATRAKEFKPEEIVFDGPKARLYPKGSFIYRLAGRDREKSASFYTPEPLARLLVKHALMERCKDLSADELLELKILEPAMGSAAFLVETASQLADLYLERKQAETGQTIPQDQILIERQRVRAYISDRNCFGVDLNPVAVELGAISLWLASLHHGTFTPWFGDQLHAGNSLLGARRATYAPHLLRAKGKKDQWFNFPPTEVGWRGTRAEGHIWQFLLPAEDMAAFDSDKSISEFAKPQQEKIKAWRKGGFFAPFADYEIALAQRLSRVVDGLFDEVAQSLAESRRSTNDAITLWPNRAMAGTSGETWIEKQRRLARLTGDDHAANSLPYLRLKTAMDAWCALWLWPLDQVDHLPSRTEFLHGMAMILEGGFSADGTLAAPNLSDFKGHQSDMFGTLEPDAPAADLFAAAPQKQLFNETNVETLIEHTPWLGVAAKVAQSARFTHFDLIFADVLRARGGFDLIVGNPPWNKPSWNEGDVIGEIDPGFVVRKLSAAQTKDIRAAALANPADRAAFLAAYTSAKGAMTATGSAMMNPYAGGGQNNLYRCFIDLSFRLTAPAGYAALIHQDGHLTDPKSGAFRREWYGRIAKHFEFSNKMKSKMFAEVHDEVKFSLNLYRGTTREISFDKFTNAFLPSQIEDSYADTDGFGELPTIKNDQGKWDTRGHRDRIIRIDHAALTAIHALTEEPSTPVDQARFLQPYSAKMLGVFRAMAQVPSLAQAIPPQRIKNQTPEGIREIEIPQWQMNRIWDETNAQKDGDIRRETAFAARAADMILSGPMFHVGNPHYKTPKAICRTSADYYTIDLHTTGEDYLPRTNYVPASANYHTSLPRCRWNETKSHVDFYRVALRAMVNLNSERSFVNAMCSRDIAHVNSVQSVCFADQNDLLIAATAWPSIPYDFLIKASGRQNIHEHDLASLPHITLPDTAKHRALRLNCLTSAYADLWNDCAPKITPAPWHSADPRLVLDGPMQGPQSWDRSAALRNDYARRMALVEIDVLVARALGLSLDQLIDIYRIYFPVLQQNEAATWYDAKGRIVWTASKGLPMVGYLNDKGKSPGRKEWDQILAANPPQLRCKATADFEPGGPKVVERVFEGPFDTCDRIADYRAAWAHFEALDLQEAAE